MLTFSTEPWGVTSSSSFDAEADVVLKIMFIKIVSSVPSWSKVFPSSNSRYGEELCISDKITKY